MDWSAIYIEAQTVISIVLIVLSLIAVIKSIQHSIKANLIEQVVKFIKNAEAESLLTGPEKMNLVIDWMKDIIPRIFKVVFAENVLRIIAQNVFNDMKKYANSYVENKTGASVDKINKIIIVSQDDPEFDKKVEELENSEEVKKEEKTQPE